MKLMMVSSTSLVRAAVPGGRPRGRLVAWWAGGPVVAASLSLTGRRAVPRVPRTAVRLERLPSATGSSLPLGGAPCPPVLGPAASKERRDIGERRPFVVGR